MEKLVYIMILIAGQVLQAQTPELIEASNGLPLGELTLVDSFLYRGGITQEVARIDISDPNYPLAVIATGSNPSQTYLRSTVDAQQQRVYLANVDENGALFSAPIVEGSTSKLTPLISQIVNAIGLAVDGSILYFVTLTPQIISIDVTNPENTAAVVYDPPNPLPIFNMHLAGGFLYYSTQSSFSQPFDWQVFRLDITANNPQPQLVTTTSNRIWTFASIGDFLYLGSDENNKISRVSLTGAFPQTEETVFAVLPTLDNEETLFSIAHDGSFLYYVTEAGIFRITDQVLSQTEFLFNTVALYPNPVTDVLFFNNLEDFMGGSYKIYGATGNLLQKGSYTEQQQTISVAHFAAGMYIVQITNGEKTSALKFIKN